MGQGWDARHGADARPVGPLLGRSTSGHHRDPRHYMGILGDVVEPAGQRALQEWVEQAEDDSGCRAAWSGAHMGNYSV